MAGISGILNGGTILTGPAAGNEKGGAIQGGPAVRIQPACDQAGWNPLPSSPVVPLAFVSSETLPYSVTSGFLYGFFVDAACEAVEVVFGSAMNRLAMKAG